MIKYLFIFLFIFANYSYAQDLEKGTTVPHDAVIIIPTTYQVLLNDYIKTENTNIDKLNYINQLLKQVWDEDTGQSLLNYKEYLIRLIKNKSTGRNYISGYKVKKYKKE